MLDELIENIERILFYKKMEVDKSINENVYIIKAMQTKRGHIKMNLGLEKAITIVISLPYFVLAMFFSGGFDYFGFSAWMIVGVVGYLVVAYAIGLISGFVFAFVYNWIADYQKGIEIDIDLVENQEKSNK